MAIERMSVRDESEAKANRMDAETAEFYTRVREAYLTIAAAEPQRFVIVDASGSIDEIHRAVSELVE